MPRIGRERANSTAVAPERSFHQDSRRVHAVMMANERIYWSEIEDFAAGIFPNS